jgi:hypothetical protein
MNSNWTWFPTANHGSRNRVTQRKLVGRRDHWKEKLDGLNHESTQYRINIRWLSPMKSPRNIKSMNIWFYIPRLHVTDEYSVIYFLVTRNRGIYWPPPTPSCPGHVSIYISVNRGTYWYFSFLYNPYFACLPGWVTSKTWHIYNNLGQQNINN